MADYVASAHQWVLEELFGDSNIISLDTPRISTAIIAAAWDRETQRKRGANKKIDALQTELEVSYARFEAGEVDKKDAVAKFREMVRKTKKLKTLRTTHASEAEQDKLMEFEARITNSIESLKQKDSESATLLTKSESFRTFSPEL